MARLAGAPFAISGEGIQEPAGGLQLAAYTWGWENGFDQGHWLSTITAQDWQVQSCPLIVAYFSRGEADGAALTVRDLVSDKDWFGSSYFETVHEPVGFGHTITAFKGLSGGGCGSFALAREALERRDFGPRD